VKLHEIPTPALVVDIAAMERNIARMADFFAGAGRFQMWNSNLD